MKSFGSKMVLLLAINFTVACDSKPIAEEKTTHSTVVHPQLEANLTTVTLTSQAQERLGISTAVISVRDVFNSETFAGEVIAKPGTSSLVTAPFAGIVTAPAGRLLAPGDIVSQGTAVIFLRPVATQTTGVSPSEDMQVKRVELENARARLKRTSSLVKAQFAREEELELAKAEVARAKAAYNSIKAQLEGVNGDHQTIGVAIGAPLGGALADYAFGLGETVSAGDPLFRVISLDAVLVRVPIFPSIASKVSEGAIAFVTPLGGSEAQGVKATRIKGAPSATAASVDLYFEIENRAKSFRPGERVEISMPLGLEERRLSMPSSAIFTDIHGGTWVYENVSEGVYTRRRVFIDYMSDNIAVLVDGPPEGTSIVTVGVAELAGTEFGAGH